MTDKFSHLSVLVIGLGSMGKRRIRNLKANGVKQIAGVDQREDRRQEVTAAYGIAVHASLDSALANNSYDAWIISVPPDLHHVFMQAALDHKTPAFIEASVVDTGMRAIIAAAKSNGVFFAPSYTLYFHPAIRKIVEIIKNGELGTLSNIIYHSGQYLPDWHSYEKVNEYYVSKKETGGAREIVPFELTWLTLALGLPTRVGCLYKKTVHIPGAEAIDDTYNLLLDYPGFMVNLCVDVVSRLATRKMTINGEKKQLAWDWDANVIRVFDGASQQWEDIPYEIADAQAGYNKNITETMYNREIETFLASLKGPVIFLNTLEKDLKVLEILYAAEKSSDSNTILHFS
jgi:predicted dehydrogenase